MKQATFNIVLFLVAVSAVVWALIITDVVVVKTPEYKQRDTTIVNIIMVPK